MGDDAGDQRLVLGQVHPAPDLPLVLVPRVRCLERIGAGSDPQNDIDDVLQLDVVGTRPHVDAVAGVEADPILRQAAQRMIERVDPHLCPFAVVRE